MELAVLAEGLHEALMKGYGDAIYTALLANRWVYVWEGGACVCGVGVSRGKGEKGLSQRLMLQCFANCQDCQCFCPCME